LQPIPETSSVKASMSAVRDVQMLASLVQALKRENDHLRQRLGNKLEFQR
jgi:hypothetical protein